jgi:hypothetical protein
MDLIPESHLLYDGLIYPGTFPEPLIVKVSELETKAMLPLLLSSLARRSVRLKQRRSITVENIQKRLNSSETKSPRLRILFFGSDSFSTTVLHELRRTKEEEPGLYESIRLVTREPARVGRGRKVSNEGTDWNVCRLD